MTRLARGTLALAAVLALSVPTVRAGTISVTFDESQLAGDNNDPIQNFYDGGDTFRGVGPGPNLGVVFADTNARLFNTAQSGTYTTPGYMVLFSDTAREGEGISTVMNVSGGFITSVFFDYAAIDAAGSLTIYSGTDGMGTKLATLALPVTTPNTSTTGFFVADSVTFSGIGHSIVFQGGNKQLAVDDLLLTSSVPEPTGLCLLAIGMAGVCLTVWRKPWSAHAQWPTDPV
jgi:hypothetical protein